jgi:hypothetical protein
MLVRVRRVVAKAIETTPNTLIATTRARMVAKGAPAHACREGLLGGEVARLRLGGSIERVVVYVMHKGEYIALASDVTSWAPDRRRFLFCARFDVVVERDTRKVRRYRTIRARDQLQR